MRRQKEQKEMSKFMKRQDALEKKKKAIQEKQAETEENPEKDSVEKAVKPESAQVTKLVFFKKYDTYQALLEVFPSESLSAKECFSKVILYIMTWFKKRLGEDVYEKYPDIVFLKKDYPMPDQYATFQPEKLKNIDGLNFLDLEVAYNKGMDAWLFSLEEPDNGKENKKLQGRTFKTEISVYQRKESVVVGIRESCREPEANEEDAFGFRPGFVRDLFIDSDLTIGEQGVKKEYAFSTSPLLLNGKSSASCEAFYNDLIASEYRQMPVLFIPGDYYEANQTEVDEKTKSLLGYCHVLVWQNTCRKLFSQVMKNEEFAEVAEEGQLIFYRTNHKEEYPTDYFEPDTEGLLSRIKDVAQHEPIRKSCDFRNFSFDVPVISSDLSIEKDRKTVSSKERLSAYEVASLRMDVGNLKRDNDALHKRNEELKAENAKLDEDYRENATAVLRLTGQNEGLKTQLAEVKEKNRQLEASKQTQDMIIRGYKQAEKERIQPLLHLPVLDKDKKNNILSWINEYYSDVLIIHPNAKKSFESDNRNIDWHRLCMMIHYLAGYTKYRNIGGPVTNPDAAREYDPEEYAFTVSPVNSGPGTLEMYRDKYTILIPGENGKKEEVLLELHLKSGKGADSNMIRIYFYYSATIRKTYIGYMPGHLPTRKDGH